MKNNGTPHHAMDTIGYKSVILRQNREKQSSTGDASEFEGRYKNRRGGATTKAGMHYSKANGPLTYTQLLLCVDCGELFDRGEALRRNTDRGWMCKCCGEKQDAQKVEPARTLLEAEGRK